MSASRVYDLILWGATGFTGRLVADYLYRQYGTTDLKWALAARNLSKLKKLQIEVADESIPLIVANIEDQKSLDNMAAQARVICTTVGPYAKYGSQLVAACVANQTHYCDLAGEVQWIRKMIDQHHDRAQANRTRIVHCCGFDSIPSDMGVFFLQQQIHSNTGRYARHIKTRLKAASGGMSGGTFASLNHVLAEAEKDKSIYKILSDPYSLNPEGERRGPDQAELQGVSYDDTAQSWLAPFIMAAINTKIVQRSHALSGYPYGKDFRYDEAMLTGDGFIGRIKATVAAGATGLVMMARPGTTIKKVADRIMPQPGEGPSREKREAGFFYFQLFGITDDGQVFTARVKGDRDPGYGSTCKMLGESAVCLARDEHRLPDHYGVLTPASAMGQALLDRLQQKAGLNFDCKAP